MQHEKASLYLRGGFRRDYGVCDPSVGGNCARVRGSVFFVQGVVSEGAVSGRNCGGKICRESSVERPAARVGGENKHGFEADPWAATECE